MAGIEENFRGVIKNRVKGWFLDPILWAEEVVGFGKKKLNSQIPPLELDDWQKEAFIEFARLARAYRIKAMRRGTDIGLSKALADMLGKKGMSIQAGRGCGKTAFAALIILWFFMCFPKAKIVILGPKFDQIKKNIWPEITRWITHSKEVYGQSIFDDFLEAQSEKIYCKHVDTPEELGKRWTISMLSYPKNTNIADQKAAIAGIHGDNLLVVFDEASGVPDHVFEALTLTLTGTDKGPNLILSIFNPVKDHGWAIQTQGMPDIWITKQINCINSSLVSQESIDGVIKHYGKDSHQYVVGVLGQPWVEKTAGGLIPYHWLIEAQERHAEYRLDESLPMIFGVDVGFGCDKSVICKRTGGYIHGFEEKDNKDTLVIVSWISDHINLEEPEVVYLDQNGAEGVFCQLRKKYGPQRIKGFKAHRRSTKPEQFDRLKDEAFWNLRTEFQNGTIAIPKKSDYGKKNQFFDELSLLRYIKTETSGLIKMVSKTNAKYKMEMRDKLGYISPNKADAASFTCVYPFEKHLRLSQEPTNSWHEVTYLQQMRAQYSSGRAYMGA